MKQRILPLITFALMALMAPLGAKGQDYTGLTVRQARNHAGDGHSVQFTGYVSYTYSTNSAFEVCCIQDNDFSGAGIKVFIPGGPEYPTDIQEGSKVSVTANKVTCSLTFGVSIGTNDVINVSVISQNHGISVMTPSLQGMKDMHYPLTEQRVIADPFQARLVRLNWLKIVDHCLSNQRDGWIVEDLHGVRDTVNFDHTYPVENLQVGKMFKRMVALNMRQAGYMDPDYERLRVRKAIDADITSLVTLQEARQLATQSNQTGNEVSVIGVVSFARFGDWNSGEIYMQTPSGDSGYGGMKVVTVGDPASRGITTGTKIIVTGTPRVINTDGYPYGPGHNNAPDMVAMMDVDVTSITVISQDAPYSFGNKTLADLRQNNPTISNVKNNTYQHNMVKLNNLTVVQHLDDKTYHGETYHYYEVSQGSGNNTVTDVLLSRDELAQNMVLPSVKVVNCRSNMLDTYHYDSNLGLSGDNHPNHLLLRSLNDIDFNTKSISYVRTHRDAPYYVEGVITARIPCEEIPGGYSFFIQDNTGGLRVDLYPELASQLAIGDRCIARVQSELADINDVYMFAYCDFITKIGSNESFTPYNGVSLAQLYAIPNLGNNIPSLNFDGRYYQFPTMQMKVRSRSHGQQGQPDEYLYVEFSQTGQNNQTMLLRMTVYKNSVSAADFDALYNSISLTTEDVTVNLKGTLSVLYDENDYDVYHFYLYPSKFSDIEIDYTSQHTVTVTEYPATQSGTHTQQAEAGETVTLQLSHINATDTYEFVSDEYSNTVWMSPHHLICTSHPDLQLTKVNTYTYRFTMPNGNVDFEAVYTPDVIHMSDVWEARAEGSPDGNPEKLAYLTCVVTDVKNELWFFIQDLNNQNCGNDELKMYQGMEVFLERGCELNVGDVVEVCGYPVNDEGVRVSITNGRILSHEGTAVAQLYATTLNDLWNDLHGSGQTAYNTRLQDRLIQLDNLIVESEYQVGQTIGNIHRIANIQAPFNLNLEVGAPLNLTALNFSDIGGANSGDLWLDLRSANDIVQDTDITFGTYSMDFDEFGSGYTDYGNHITYHYVNIPMTLGGSLSNPVINWSDDWIVGNPGTNYEEPPVIQMDNKKFRFVVTPNPTTETRTCTITISANGFTSQPFVITQTGCGPAEFTVSPDFQSFGPVDPNYSSKGLYSQTGYINITDISHVAQPYGSHITTSVVSAYTGQNTDWFSLGAWDAENQRFPFTIANNNDPSSVTRGVNVAIIMEGTDGTLVQHEAAVHQSGPGASVTVTPNWWSAEAPLCQQVTKTFEVNYTNFNLAVNPARVWLEASDFNDDDVEVSIEPSPASPVELTEAAGTIYYQVTFLVKNAGSHYGTFKARVQEQDIGDWWDSFDSQEASVWVSGLHPGNIDTNATSTETLNSLGFPTWYVMDPDTYQFVDTLSFIQVSIASEALGQQAEMCMPDPENNGFVITCMPFDPTYVSGNSTLIPLHDGTYLIQLGGSWLAWDSDQGLHDEWISLNTPDDIANIPAKNKWNISFSGENAVISPSTNPNYSLRMVSVMVPNPENPEETILDYRIVCINEGGTPLQIFYHKEGELASPTFSEATPYFYEGQSVTVTLTPAENTTLAYTLEEDYDNPVTSNVPVTLTFTETTKVIAWSMLECQTYSLDGLVEHTYYNINTIAEARANANMECYIHGIVSSADHVHNRYFVQDETSGVEIGIDWTIWENVYNNHDSLVALQNGDEIVLKGWCDEYGMFTGATYDWNSSTTYDEPEVAKLSTGNTVAPLIVTFDDLYETTDAQYLGRLVKLENEQVTVWAGSPETYQLRHGTPEEPHYLEFPRTMENQNTEFPLNDGDIIDLTAVYVNGGFNNPKEIVKGISLTVEGYGNSTNGKWAFIASPVEGSIMPVEVDNLFCNEFDLYRFDQNQDAEWRNYKAGSFNLANGQGYLYATEEDVTLIFKGDFFDGDSKTVSLNYSDGNEFSGWNLVGNPFATAARANRSYYKMNSEGTAIEAASAYSTTNIAPCTGVMVQAEGSNESITFTPLSSSLEGGPLGGQGLLNITLNQANTRGSAFVDNAIVSFNEGDRLGKFSFGESDATLCIPQGGKDCAIAFAQRQGEMPLNFKAAKNGTYTLNFSSQEVSFSYLHLIDNMTGADIDLLVESNYTFEAKTTDYASRFRLVFSSNCGDAVVDNEAFAFIDASGNIVINGIVGDAGTASLQVIDMTGRVILRRDALNASQTIPTGGMAPGVYMMRLMNGDSVRTQKIVVR